MTNHQDHGWQSELWPCSRHILNLRLDWSCLIRYLAIMLLLVPSELGADIIPLVQRIWLPSGALELMPHNGLWRQLYNVGYEQSYTPPYLTTFKPTIGNYGTGDSHTTCIPTLWSLMLCLGLTETDMLKFLQPILVGYESSQCVPSLRHMSHCIY